jgi:flagellar basal-body rod protein FlgB
MKFARFNRNVLSIGGVMSGDSINILEKILDVAAFRHRVLASNIANADTPGYKAKDISFQEELNKAIENPGSATEGQRFHIFEVVTTMPNRDGNTVNLNIEMAKIAENTLIYNTATSLMAKNIRMLKDVIRGGR